MDEIANGEIRDPAQLEMAQRRKLHEMEKGGMYGPVSPPYELVFRVVPKGEGPQFR
jgi:hypothetical protein